MVQCFNSLAACVGGVLLSECSLEQPADNREVAALIVGREDDGVLVLFLGHCVGDGNY